MIMSTQAVFYLKFQVFCLISLPFEYFIPFCIIKFYAHYKFNTAQKYAPIHMFYFLNPMKTQIIIICINFILNHVNKLKNNHNVGFCVDFPYPRDRIFLNFNEIVCKLYDL